MGKRACPMWCFWCFTFRDARSESESLVAKAISQLADQQMIDHRLIDGTLINFLAPFGPSMASVSGNVHMFFEKEFLDRHITRIWEAWWVTRWRKKHRGKSHVKIFEISLKSIANVICPRNKTCDEQGFSMLSANALISWHMPAYSPPQRLAQYSKQLPTSTNKWLKYSSSYSVWYLPTPLLCVYLSVRYALSHGRRGMHYPFRRCWTMP